MRQTINEICRSMQRLTGRQDLWQVWCDFNLMAATTLANAADLRQPVRDDREAEYLRAAGRYKPKELNEFARILALVIEAFEEQGPADILGQAYMQMELGNKYGGQFFTPDSVCQAMAATMVDDQMRRLVDQNGFITLSEPACGGGAMVLALAHRMLEEGLNPQQQLHVTAVDVDLKSVHMAYIQFSLIGIPAVVVHGNTLSMQEWSHWYTPFHIFHGWNHRLRSPRPALKAEREIKVFAPDDQVALF